MTTDMTHTKRTNKASKFLYSYQHTIGDEHFADRMKAGRIPEGPSTLNDIIIVTVTLMGGTLIVLTAILTGRMDCVPMLSLVHTYRHRSILNSA